MDFWFGKVSAQPTTTIAALSAAAAVMAAGDAAAAEAQHALGLLSGNTWQASFTILAAPTALLLGRFTLYFDQVLASQPQLVAFPAGRDTLVIPPDACMGTDGRVNGLADPPAELSPGSSPQGRLLSMWSVELQTKR